MVPEVAIVVIPDSAPAVVTLSPEPAVKAKVVPARAKVPVEFPIVVDAEPVELIKVVPKIVVEPLIALVPPDAPKVLMAPIPAPKVLVKEAPVPIVELPEEVRVVKEPAPPEMPPDMLVNVAAPAFVTFQVLPVPEISLPVPAFDIANTSPVAEAFD